MSLLDETQEKCVMIDKTTAPNPDGYGGIISVYTEGAEFSANVFFDSSMQAKIAAAQGVKSLYTVLTNKNVLLNYHDIFMRVEDRKTFRITSDGYENKTPDSATLQKLKYSAEEYKLESKGGQDSA